MGEFCAEGCHGIAMLHMLACKVVELVQVLLIAADDNAAACLLCLDHCFEHNAVPFLYELTD